MAEFIVSIIVLVLVLLLGIAWFVRVLDDYREEKKKEGKD